MGCGRSCVCGGLVGGIVFCEGVVVFVMGGPGHESQDQCGVWSFSVGSEVHRRWNHFPQVLQRTEPPSLREDVIRVKHEGHVYI